MDSQWINQQATKMNDHDDQHNNITGKNKQVDLTLKLGLPHSLEKNNQPHFDFAPLPPNHANVNIHGSYSQSQAINHLEMVNHGVNANVNNIVGQSLNANEIAWLSKFGSQFHAQYMQPNGYGIGPFSAGSSLMAPPQPMCTNPYYYNNFNVNPNLNPNPNFLLPSTPIMNDYTLLDIPARRAIAREFGSSSSSRKNGLRRQHGVSYIDPYKRCTNYNCNTNDTPMWRKGPLGPKTLCNACGIKYRKEEEKRKAKEAAKNQESNNEFG